MSKYDNRLLRQLPEEEDGPRPGSRGRGPDTELVRSIDVRFTVQLRIRQLDPPELLAETLYFAIAAPNDEKAAQADALVDQIAAGLTPGQIEEAKAEVLVRVAAEESK